MPTLIDVNFFVVTKADVIYSSFQVEISFQTKLPNVNIFAFLWTKLGSDQKGDITC